MLTSLFFPEMVGTLSSIEGTDLRGRPTWSAEVSVGYTPIRIKVGVEKTSIRTDKSASQSRSEEVHIEGRVLIEPTANVVEGSRFTTANGREYRILTVQEIYDATGLLDHYQADLGL